MTRTLLAALLFTASVPCSATPLRTRAAGYELQVLVDGRPVRSYWHDGGNWLLGHLGERYTLRVVNHSGRRIEAVVSVDGKDVIDGQPGDPGKRGYLVPARGSVDIDGWRISSAQAAAFRFSSVGDSYAARTGSGREVGVIGVAVFEERDQPPPRPAVVQPPPRPYYEESEGESCCQGARNEAPAPPQQADAKPSTKSYAEKSAPRDAPPPVAAKPEPRSPPSTMPASPAEVPPQQALGALGGTRGAGSDYTQRKEQRERPGLGTEYGEAVSSQVYEVAFERESSRPAFVLGCHYDNRAGLLALGIDVDGSREADLRRSADPFPVVDRRYAAPPPGWRR